MIKVRVMNEYQIDTMLKSDIEINYDNFYKDQLIDMLKVCRDRYKKELETKNKVIQYVKNNIVYDTGKPYRRDLLQMLGGDVDDE